MGKRIFSPVKRKALLLLAGGISLGMATNPRSQKYAFGLLRKEWHVINRQYLYRIVKEFKQERLIKFHEKTDGTTEIVLTEKGKLIVLEFDIDKLEIGRPLRWDKKWRFVFFDIPEKRRSERNILRNKLKELGFHEIQKSIFIHPYPCLNEINFIIEYFKLRNLVRYGEMTNISNEAELQLKFKLY